MRRVRTVEGYSILMTPRAAEAALKLGGRLELPDDPKCPRCGCALKIKTVRVPVYGDDARCGGGSLPIERYEEREEVSDCPRCTGAY